MATENAAISHLVLRKGQHRRGEPRKERASSIRRLARVLAGLFVLGWLAPLVPAPPADAFGSSQPLPLPSVVAGGYMTCGVQADGTAACWGENGVPSNDIANTHPGGMSTPPAGVKFLEVNPGYATACGVKTDQTITCWGSGRYNKHFDIPSGTFTHVAPGLNYICALRTDGTIACWGGDDLDPNRLVLTDIPSGTFSQVSVGNRNACALRTDGTIACWGINTDGQNNVPAPNTPGSYKYVNISNFTSCALRTDGTPVCWGRNQGGQQTYPSGTFDQLHTGFAHVCGLRPDKTISCWGRNAEGQSAAPAGTYTHVTAGTFHSCAMPESGPPARCWGNNAAGRVQPIMSNTAPQPGYVGSPYSFQFTMGNPAQPPAVQAHLSPAPSYTASGALPPGLQLSPSGLLSGAPTAAGSYTFKVAASNGLSPPDCVNSGGGSLSCTPGDTASIATATREHTMVIGAVAPAPGTLAGMVTVAGSGASVAGAIVAVTHNGGAPAGQATADGNGNYSLANLFPGTYNVTASGEGLQPSTQPATITEDQTTTLDFVLGPLVRPTIVAVSNNHWQTVTDGLFVEWSEPFEQRLDPTLAHGYTIHEQAGCSDAPVATAFRGNWMPDRQNSTPPLVSPSVPSRVRDMEMTGWQNVLPGNSYYLQIGANTEFGLTTKQRNEKLCVPFVAELRALDHSTVGGQVTSAGGAVAGATVTVTRTLREPGSVAGQATTDGNGNYQIANLPPGPYDVSAAAPGLGPKTSTATTTGNNTTTTVNFALNSVPVAADDAYTHYGSDTALVVAAAGVLANDRDADNDPLTASLVSGPSQGTLALNPNGSFTYQPNEDYVGSDSFTYKANDGSADSNVATVTITVGAGCRGRAATITGTSAGERLIGTSGADVIVGLGGNDTINAAGGDDVLCGGSGNDAVNADVGDDYADGGSGDDSLRGDLGNDTLIGGAGADTTLGDGGDDLLSGGAGSPDSCQGGDGTDALAPEHGCERINGVP